MLETDIFVIVVMCLVLIGMFVCITLIIEKGKKEEKAERMKKALAYQNELKQRQKDFDEKMESLKNQYGDITIDIKLSNGDIEWDNLSFTCNVDKSSLCIGFSYLKKSKSHIYKIARYLSRKFLHIPLRIISSQFILQLEQPTRKHLLAQWLEEH